MQMGVGGVQFSREFKRYKGVTFNVISVTRGWIQISGKKRYVKLEWPRINIFVTIQGGAEARDGAATTERGEGEGAEGAEGDDDDGGGKGEETETEETCRECEAAARGEQGARDARRYHQGMLLCFIYCYGLLYLCVKCFLLAG